MVTRREGPTQKEQREETMIQSKCPTLDQCLYENSCNITLLLLPSSRSQTTAPTLGQKTSIPSALLSSTFSGVGIDYCRLIIHRLRLCAWRGCPMGPAYEHVKWWKILLFNRKSNVFHCFPDLSWWSLSWGKLIRWDNCAPSFAFGCCWAVWRGNVAGASGVSHGCFS